MLGTLVAGLLALSANAQSNRVIGTVAAVDPAARQIALKTDSGSIVTATIDDKTSYLRVPPGEKDLSKAVKITLADIGGGDRVLARGSLSQDQKTVAATTVIVMSKSDLAQKQERQRGEWLKRGVLGVVSTVNFQTGEITLAQRGAKPIVVEAGPNVRFRRYAPDSVRFADAKPGSFEEIKAGDQLRALGEKSADGVRFKAEEIVTGSFRTLAATIRSVDAAAGDLRITDLETKKQVTVHTNSDSMLRRIPPMLAERLAQRREGGPDLQQVLERTPALSLADLKSGDAIIVSSTRGADPSRITAIVLVAGVEPMLTAGPAGPIGGAWNFEIGLP